MKSRTFLKRAQRRMSSGQYKRSLSDFDQAIALDAGSARAHFGRAELCCIIDDKEEAAGSYERYLALLREDAEPSVVAEAYLTYGEMLLDLSREQEALEQFRHSIELIPSGRACFLAGRTYLYLGTLDEALANFEKGIEVDPGYPGSYFGKSGVYEMREQRIELRGSYEELLQRDPGNVLAHYFAADTCRRLGDNEAALAHYDAAAGDSEPRRAFPIALIDPLQAKAILYTKMRRHQLAIDTYERLWRPVTGGTPAWMANAMTADGRDEYVRALDNYGLAILAHTRDDD